MLEIILLFTRAYVVAPPGKVNYLYVPGVRTFLRMVLGEFYS